MKTPFVESVIWSLIVILSIIIVILIIYLKVLRNNIRTNEKRIIKYTKFAEELLIQFLYSEEEGVAFSEEQIKVLEAFKKGISNKRKRKIIILTFIKLSQEISGNMILTMHKLYEEIGLLKFAIKKLRSKKWNVVALGIRDLREFKVKKTQHLITKFINHNKEEVRREAHLYFIELFGYEGLSFLDNLQVPLSEWDQIELLGEVQKIENHNILDVIKWLNSKNDYVVMFILRVVKLYNRLETKDVLVSLLDRDNEGLRIKVLDVLTHFGMPEANEIMKLRIEQLSIKEKIAFFDLLEKTATEQDSVFILDHINNDDFEIKYRALKTLKKIDGNLYNKLEKKTEDPSFNKIIHFLDYSYGF